MNISEIRQRAEKATPGPWSLRPAEWECDCGGDEDGHTHKAPDQCRDGWWLDSAWVAGPILIENGDGWTGFNDADADFMAHAREDVPALCDSLDAAIARAEQAEAALERCGAAGLELRAELADVYRRAEKAEAALAERDAPCVWRETDRDENGNNAVWSGSCGKTSIDAPGAGWHGCPYCLRPILVEVQP